MRRHGAAPRDGGRYPDPLLAADARRIRRWPAAGGDVYVYFNSDAQGHAVRDARRLAARLGRRAAAPGRRRSL